MSPEISPELLTNLKLFLTTSLVDFGVNALGAVLILAIGWRLAGWASSATRRAVEHSPRFDVTLRPLTVALVRYAILGFTMLAVLARFGVQTTSIIAVFGAAGLAIGLALQGTLSNVAAGVMLLVLRPFKVNDVILVGGHTGKVLQIGLFTTELNTPDNVFVSLPNSSVWNAAIVNYTHNPSRRFDLTIGISYDDDIDRALGLVAEVLAELPAVVSDPPPMVGVRALGESSVDLVVRGFVAQADYWSTVFAVQRAVKLRFDAEDITIPYPQRTLHLQPGALSREVS